MGWIEELRLATLALLFLVSASISAPVDPESNYNAIDYKNREYEFSYTVDDPPSRNYYGHSEKGFGEKTEGKYFVLMPDGRIMTVEYYVDPKSGFRPKITFSSDPSSKNRPQVSSNQKNIAK